MHFATLSGPPSSGKTSVLMKLLPYIQAAGQSVGVAKFDCIQSVDDEAFESLGIPVVKGLAGELCPDHFFASNIEGVFHQAQDLGFDWLFSESAGLCNRCAPHIKDVTALCVIDQMAGVNTPAKIGPMLKLADIIVVTKSDVVSQAEREVFTTNVRQVNDRALVFHVNGLTGEGAYQLYQELASIKETADLAEMSLRSPMPMATCSYCLGERRLGEEFLLGNTRKIRDNFTRSMETIALKEEGGDQPGLDYGPEYDKRADQGPRVSVRNALDIKAIQIQPGFDKDGQAEDFDLIELRQGDVVALVGPTGSGKSRLLEDIAMGSDSKSLTGRTISYDGQSLSQLQDRYDGQRLVSHLSQNMNFVIDLTVEEFLHLHLQCWEEELCPEKAELLLTNVLNMANQLTGEKIQLNQDLASLSGGQSRSLMIADCAFISPAPIMLLDEIENAGIQKGRAIELLADGDKIVLMSTHDPLLALMADYRIVIKNGGIQAFLKRSQEEAELMEDLEVYDDKMFQLREKLRSGKRLD